MDNNWLSFTLPEKSRGTSRAVGDVCGCVWTKSLSRFCFMFSVENDYTPVRLEATPNSTKMRKKIRVSQSQTGYAAVFLLSTVLQFCFRFVVQPTVAFHFLTFAKKDFSSLRRLVGRSAGGVLDVFTLRNLTFDNGKLVITIVIRPQRIAQAEAREISAREIGVQTEQTRNHRPRENES